MADDLQPGEAGSSAGGTGQQGPGNIVGLMLNQCEPQSPAQAELTSSIFGAE